MALKNSSQSATVLRPRLTRVATLSVGDRSQFRWTPTLTRNTGKNGSWASCSLLLSDGQTQEGMVAVKTKAIKSKSSTSRKATPTTHRRIILSNHPNMHTELTNKKPTPCVGFLLNDDGPASRASTCTWSRNRGKILLPFLPHPETLWDAMPTAPLLSLGSAMASLCRLLQTL